MRVEWRTALLPTVSAGGLVDRLLVVSVVVVVDDVAVVVVAVVAVAVVSVVAAGFSVLPVASELVLALVSGLGGRCSSTVEVTGNSGGTDCLGDELDSIPGVRLGLSRSGVGSEQIHISLLSKSRNTNFDKTNYINILVESGSEEKCSK